MNKKSIYFGTLLLAALTLGSCASDDTATDKPSGKNTLKVSTVFSSEEDPATRTSAKYTGSGLDFYWTASDKIWVKDDNGDYNQNADDDINTRIAAVPGSTTTDKAKFWVNGSYTGSTHKVRYTGKNGTSDKVTIKASQTQNTPNDAAHIADDGDFGIAEANRSGVGYNFTLNHKAAYITFMPYSGQSVLSVAKIQKIRVFTTNAMDRLAGTFDLADDGTLSNAVSATNSIELETKGSQWGTPAYGGFPIPKTSSYSKNSATMVVAPGTYNNLSIEYTLIDTVTNITGTITKTYANVTFAAGINTPVRTNLQVKEYPGDDYYTWDAQVGQHYWKGYEYEQPTTSTSYYSGNNYPHEYDPRYYRMDYKTIPAPSLPFANNSAKDCPNINEYVWYLKKGDPHWDDKTLWATMGHLYTGGMWFKHQSVIASEQIPVKSISDLKTAAPDGTDYRILSWSSSYHVRTSIQKRRPEKINDYFFLPAFGEYFEGNFMFCGSSGRYWSNTPETWNPGREYYPFAQLLHFTKDIIMVTGGTLGERERAGKLFKTSQENQYSPF